MSFAACLCLFNGCLDNLTHHLLVFLPVPGIGPAAEKKLNENGITNVYQLFGEYLRLKGSHDGEQISSLEHHEKVFFWLKGMGINAYRSGIVRALAEKAATFFPKIVSCVWIHVCWALFCHFSDAVYLPTFSPLQYDPDQYDDDEEDKE